ncbi:MAG: TIGR00645 family protein [Actinobacteria bacterium]|uniref:Unannotated protein n=1 Tax=freshwater metagenome TaxID=449393 RepID=A0A6J6P671_9ZZZZ|nr:TIGR00645 family protein [Actinomycetota bacterium]
MKHMSETPTSKRFVLQTVEGFIFFSRWFQVPLYVGLICAQLFYVVEFTRELWRMFVQFEQLTETTIMLGVLGLVDVVMVSNLLMMVIIGGYETFVSRLDLEGHPDEPEWLSQVNANVLKVKLAMAIIGISSVHLLRSFIEADQLASKDLLWKTLIHLTFIVSAVALAFIDRMSHSAPYGTHSR